MTWTEVESVSGYLGNFTVKLKKKPRYVDISKCNSCGACYEACPSVPLPSRRRMTLGGRVYREGRLLDVQDKWRMGPKHDLTILTGAQPMPENLPIPTEVKQQ